MLPPDASPWRPSAFRVWKAACLLLLVRVCWTLRSQCTTYALLWCNCSPLRSGWRAQDEDLTCQAGTMARDGQLITAVEGSSSDHSIMRRPHNTGELDSAKAAWAALPTTRNKLWPGTRASDNHGRMQAVRKVSPNQGAAPPLGGPPTAGGDSSRLVVCQALGRQVLRWDVHRASSSRTAGPRDQHEERAHTL